MPGARNPSQRIKGQEVSVLLTRDGALEDTLSDIQEFEFEPIFETKVQGYLGEKNERTDYIFKHAKWSMTLNVHKQDWLKYLAAMKDKAQRNTPDVQFNISCIFALPNGETPQVSFNDVSFEGVPHTISSRGDYLKIKLAGVCDDIGIQTV